MGPNIGTLLLKRVLDEVDHLFSHGDLFRRRGQVNYCPAASA